jgi:hypothetical protein
MVLSTSVRARFILVRCFKLATEIFVANRSAIEFILVIDEKNPLLKSLFSCSVWQHVNKLKELDFVQNYLLNVKINGRHHKYMF